MSDCRAGGLSIGAPHFFPVPLPHEALLISKALVHVKALVNSREYGGREESGSREINAFLVLVYCSSCDVLLLYFFRIKAASSTKETRGSVIMFLSSTLRWQQRQTLIGVRYARSFVRRIVVVPRPGGGY